VAGGSVSVGGTVVSVGLCGVQVAVGETRVTVPVGVRRVAVTVAVAVIVVEGVGDGGATVTVAVAVGVGETVGLTWETKVAVGDSCIRVAVAVAVAGKGVAVAEGPGVCVGEARDAGSTTGAVAVRGEPKAPKFHGLPLGFHARSTATNARKRTAPPIHKRAGKGGRFSIGAGRAAGVILACETGGDGVRAGFWALANACTRSSTC